MTTAATRPYRLIRPCPKCPFRTDVDSYLRPGRAHEIAQSIAEGGEFHCHETTVPDPEDLAAMTADATSAVCAGSLIMLENQGTPSQMMRVSERLGIYDPDRLDMDSPVVGSTAKFVRHHGAETFGDVEHCEVAGPGCDDPAGWLIGGSVVPNTEPGQAEGCCTWCGRPACPNCLTTSAGEEVVCVDCSEHEADQ